MPEQRKVIRWEEPPAAKGGKAVGTGKRESVWDAVAAQLRTRRGEWALVREVKNTHPGGGDFAARITFGRLDCFAPAGDYEAVSRRDGDIVRVYARYLGDGIGGEPDA